MILRNKNILVTGAGKGIGLAVTREAVKEGAFVYAITRSKSDLEKLRRIKNLKVFIGNVNNIAVIKKVLKESISNKKLISGLVNNSGERQRLEFNKISSQKLYNIFNSNLFSVFKIMQIYSQYLIKKKKPGSVVNIGSIVGQLGFKELAGYASTKSALVGLTKSFAAEMSEKNIRANLVNPGFTKTSFYEKFRKNKKGLYKWTIQRTPMKRWGEPEEISNLICFLLSDKASFITGETINVDGGWTSS